LTYNKLCSSPLNAGVHVSHAKRADFALSIILNSYFERSIVALLVVQVSSGSSDFATPTLGRFCEASGDRKVRGAGSETGEVKNSFWLFLGEK